MAAKLTLRLNPCDGCGRQINGFFDVPPYKLCEYCCTHRDGLTEPILEALGRAWEEIDRADMEYMTRMGVTNEELRTWDKTLRHMNALLAAAALRCAHSEVDAMPWPDGLPG